MKPGETGSNSEEEAMDSRKKKIFIGAGGAAVVIAAGLLIFNPDFPRKDASGAIGAVEKHRETQIAAQDVVLTDEKTRKIEQTLYADFLADAAKLENMSADLGIIAVLIGNMDQSLGASNLKQNLDDGFKRRINNLTQSLENHSLDLQSRWAAGMAESLGVIAELQSEVQMLGTDTIALESMTADLASMTEAVQNRQQLENAEMLSLNQRLQSFVTSLEAKKSRGLDNFDVSLEAKGKRNLDNFSAELNNLVASLEMSADLNNEVILESKKRLDNFAVELGSAEVLSLGMADRVEYLGSLAQEQGALFQARQQLGSFTAALEMGNAVELASRFEDVSASLGNMALDLESKALGNLTARLESANALDVALGNMEIALESKRKNLDNFSASLDSKVLGSFDQSLSNLTQQIENRRNDLYSKTALNMQAELASIEAFLANRQKLESEFAAALGSFDRLESRKASTLDNRQQIGNAVSLESRQQGFGSRQNLGSFEAYLGNLSAALESRNNNLGSKMQNRQQLESEVMVLQNRVAQIGNRQQQP